MIHADRFAASRLMPFAWVVTLSCAALPASALPSFLGPGAPACSSCHLSVPVLDARGMRFLRAGDRAPTPAAGAAGATVRVAAVLELAATHTRSDSLEAGTGLVAHTGGGFRAPMVAAHATGSLGGGASFHVEATLDSANGAVRLPVAAVQFGDLSAGHPLALRVGAFDAGLPFLSSARRLTRVAYLAPVAVDARGVEVAGARAEWSGAVGMMNSSRSGAGEPRGFDRLEDSYARVVREFGDQVVGGRLLFDRQDSDISWHAWLQHLQFQAGGLLGSDRLWFVPAYTLDRFDDRPAAGIHLHHHIVTLEAIALLGERREWTLCGRVENDHVPPTRLSPRADLDREALALVRELSDRVRASVELGHFGVAPDGSRAWNVDAALRLAFGP